MIEVRRVDFAYRRPRRYRQLIARPFGSTPDPLALEAIDLEIEAGGRLAILGRNGAGKTTLLRLLGGMLHPLRGVVRVRGRDTVADARAVRALVGYAINEDRSFYWRLNGRENLEFFAALNDLHGAAASRRIGDLLVRVGLGHAAERPVAEYSSGMRQRLAIARGLLHDPAVLLLDEPTRSLDPEGAVAIRAFLVEWVAAAAGRALAMTTNEPADVAAVCTRQVVIADRRIVEDGAPSRDAQGGRVVERPAGEEPLALRWRPYA